LCLPWPPCPTTRTWITPGRQPIRLDAIGAGTTTNLAGELAAVAAVAQREILERDETS